MSTADDRDRLPNDDHLLKRSLTPTDAVAAGPCLDAETLAAWADGSTRIPGADELERHLALCARCQGMLAAFANAEVAETAFVAASTQATADRPPNVVPFRPAWRQWIPIAVGAVAASLVIYAAWPRPIAPASPRMEQTIANAEPAAGTLQASPAPAMRTDELSIAKATPTDARVERRAQASGIVRSARQAAAAPRSAAVPAPAPLPAPVTAPPASVSATTGTVALASPPPSQTAAGAAATAKPAEVNMLRTVNESTLDAVSARVVAEFGAPTTTPLPAAQALIGRAAGAGGGGRGAGGRSGGLMGTTQPIARVSWRVLAAGQVERSINGGQAWAPVTITPAVTVVNGTAPSASVCWLIAKGGIVLRSTDGVTFRRVQSPDVADLLSITAIDELQATVTTIDGRVFKTIDGGDHWTE